MALFMSTVNAAKPAASLPQRYLASKPAASLPQRYLASPVATRATRLVPLASIPKFRFGDAMMIGTQRLHTLSRDAMPTHLHPSHSTSINVRFRVRGKTKMIPRKAAIALTPKARDFFRKMISATGSEGIFLKYEISSQHALRMAFKFDLIKDAQMELTAQDEG